jgi:hypothetical protein
LIYYGTSVHANEKDRAIECKKTFNYKFSSGFGFIISTTALSPSRNRYALPIVNPKCGSRDKYEAA